MKTPHLLVLLTLASTLGCKKENANSANPAPATAAEAASPTAAPPAPVSIVPPEIVATAPAPPANFAALNQALQLWVPIKGFPKDLNELVTAKYIAQLPPLPPGKKFAIDESNIRVIVVDQ